MATYKVTTLVTCASASEYTAFQAHLAAHGTTDTSHPGWLSVVSDSAARTVTLVKEDTADQNEWA